MESILTLVGMLMVAVISGLVMPVQAGVNSQLGRVLGHPILAALASFGVGTIALAIYAWTSGVKLPATLPLSPGSAWMWVGGLFGAFYVAVMVILLPRLGAATTVSLAIAGQMLASILLDHFGVLGVPTHPAQPLRLLGALLVFLGVVLIRMF